MSCKHIQIGNIRVGQLESRAEAKNTTHGLWDSKDCM